MVVWAILTLAVALVTVKVEPGEIERLAERVGPEWLAASLILAAAEITAPVALAWWTVKSIVRAVVR